MSAVVELAAAEQAADEEALFAGIARDLRERGFAIYPNALPGALTVSLQDHLAQMNRERFTRAGVGRQDAHTLNDFVRTDEICWINGESEAGRAWLEWAARLQHFLNRELLLGLFSFESHFAHYRPGDFYRKHWDAFRGEANRVLSLVVYLNPDWQLADGGELVLYKDPDSATSLKVLPGLGTMALFLSEEFSHEVLPARRDRYSIAGWYRVNQSTAQRPDPPR